MFPVLFFLIADHSISNKSATFDETAHITAGYAYWHTGDFRLNPQNGLFPQMWVALPLSGYVFPDQKQAAWKRADLWSIGDQFLHQQHNDVTSILSSSRRMNILLGMLLGIGVFFWSLSLWGYYGGLLSLGLYSFSPLVIAHSRLATTDIATSLGFLLALLMMWKLIHEISARNILFAGMSLGLLALSKMSVIIMAPVIILLLLAGIFAKHKQATRSLADISATHYRLFFALLTAIVIAIIVIWLPHLYGGTEYEFDWRILDQVSPVMASLLSFFQVSSFVARELFVWPGICFVSCGRQTGVCSRSVQRGWILVVFPLCGISEDSGSNTDLYFTIHHRCLPAKKKFS